MPDEEELQQLVTDGVIDESQVDDFEDLDEELQEAIVEGEVDFDEIV